MAVMQPLDPHWEFPPGDVVSCGNRLDLFRAQRRHDWRDAGRDVRWQFDGTFAEVSVAICIACGKDEQNRKGAGNG